MDFERDALRWTLASYAGNSAEAITPPEVSLLELVMVLAEITESSDEIFATVDYMLARGSVRLRPIEAREVAVAA